MGKRGNDEERAVAVVEPSVPTEALATRELTDVSIIRPVASADEVLSAWRQFQELKRSLLTIEDYQDIQGKPRIKKSGWRKIAAAFGISDQIVREERREIDGGSAGGRYFVWEITVRAVAPNGRYSDAVGSCASNERRFAHLDHDVRAIANTRAKNRAIADLVGGGEVSAEELDAELEQRAAMAAMAGGASNGTSRAPAQAEPAAQWAGETVTDAQLRAIRAHLRRTGIEEARACARAGVETLDALTRRAAAELLAALSRQPNAA
jgi:hypothetical protein